MITVAPYHSLNKIGLWILILFSFTGINIITIGKAMLTPFHLLMVGMILLFLCFKQKQQYTLPVSLGLLAGWILIVNIMNFQHIRITSFFYSLVYFVEFFIIYNLCSFFKQSQVKKALRIILIAYGINLMIGSLFLFLKIDLPIISKIIRSYTIIATGEARPMGFSTEPSYAGFIIGITFLSYNYLNQHNWDKPTKKLMVIYLFSVMMLQSAYAFLYLGINLLDSWIWIYKKGSIALKKVVLASSLLVLLGLSLFFQKTTNEGIQRIKEMTQIFTSTNWTLAKKMKRFQEVDSSGFARIGPSYLLYVKRNTYSQNMWLGGGAGKASIFLPNFLKGILVNDGVNFDAGIFPSFIIDNGLIGLGLLLFFLSACFYNLPFPFWISFALILPNANINTQLFWYGIIIFLLVSNFINKTE